jgi:hypothetical protein
VLFTTLCTRGASLAILAPHSTWAQKAIEHWDYASIAGMTRSILEIRLALFYLCIEKCDRTEWDCRWNIFNLHDCISRSLLFAEMEGKEEQVAGLEKQAEELRDRLRSNSFFSQLPEKQRNRFLRGRDAYMAALEDVAERADVERKMFRWLYKFLSSHVHGLPMSFYRVGDKDRGRGIYSTVEEGYISLCLSFASTLLTRARQEIDELFSPFVDKDGKPLATPDGDANAATEAQLRVL